jgi:hypothetical protein
VRLRRAELYTKRLWTFPWSRATILIEPARRLSLRFTPILGVNLNHCQSGNSLYSKNEKNARRTQSLQGIAGFSQCQKFLAYFIREAGRNRFQINSADKHFLQIGERPDCKKSARVRPHDFLKRCRTW